MNRTLKRVLGLTGSVMLGLAGAVTFASAAQAHHPDVTGTPTCLPDGSWQVEWAVVEGDWHNKPADLEAWIDTVESDSDAEITGAFTLGTTFGDKVKLPDPELDEAPITATQVLDAGVESVSLKVATKWSNERTDPGEPVTVEKPDTGCQPDPEPETPEPALTHHSDCFGITVTVSNGNPEALSTFTISTGSGEDIVVTPEVDEPYTESFFVEDVEAGLTVTVVVDDGEPTVIEWEGLPTCPTIESTVTCEGLEVTVTVPENGTETTFTFAAGEGDPIVVTVAPGATETVFIPGIGTELEISYEADAGKFYETGTLYWAKPVECDEESPAPSETPSAQPQLPTTGSSLTIMISSAAALIVAAAAIFLIMRRRRTAQDW
ncbi:LPXTG cell wall anchor domain-containing protein [Glycomyces sp. TRM65418]|uniref:LPXTG cell wall anchor domain-containing protein n=1 Tax=Glycomyces sp. TRM65418 TaxID=2867006 RepID=UPI001CE5232D|nr:LPXTG cell wall anchor domain-containing protein [Glycomyces sp. TRM65418]MCC3762129.1 LPXTG cell wall anchor domain-containing protein [Glycomyces sp. TRM65418]QZD56193.1 LPXTG cell wall anchor domain-containing protein [Glycomyces sp. TRM65418]